MKALSAQLSALSRQPSARKRPAPPQAFGKSFSPRLHASALIAILALLTGCGTVFTSIVTVTEAVQAVRVEYARAWASDLVPAEVDARVEKIDAAYLDALGALEIALVEAKAIGGADKDAKVVEALAAVKRSAQPLLDIVAKYVTAPRLAQLTTDLNRSVAP